MGWSNEFKVGALLLITVPAGIWALRWSIDGLTADIPTYTLHLSVPSAEGLLVKAPIKVAGVEIGEIGRVTLEGDHAVLDLSIRVENGIPTDSFAEIRSQSLLTGEKYIIVDLGTDGGMKPTDGTGYIELKDKPADFEKITKNVETISDDLKEITASLRAVTDNDDNREALEATLQNIQALSDELNRLAERNAHDIDAIVESTKRLTDTLDGMATDTRGDVKEEMEKLKAATDALQKTTDDVRSVTHKIDSGEGTIGALVNDRTTVDLLNETIGNANGVIEGFSGMHSEVYYNGRIYFGSSPQERHPEFFYGNPLAGGGANIVGVRLMPQEDFWYNFEFVDYPQGTVTYEEELNQTTGEVTTIWKRAPDYRLTFMMNKRFHHLGIRLGIKEDGGGLGASYWTFDDKLEFQGDLFDFDLGRYPAVNGPAWPNARILARYRPMPHVYVEVGTEQPFLGLQYGYATGFVGAGFNFDDDDIKLLLATLPLGL